MANKFDDFPLVGGWGRRPLELATLRLQNLVDVQFKHWDALKPVDDRCLTPLGGCAVVGAAVGVAVDGAGETVGTGVGESEGWAVVGTCL